MESSVKMCCLHDSVVDEFCMVIPEEDDAIETLSLSPLQVVLLCALADGSGKQG